MVLVTDGAMGIGRGSLRNTLQTLKQRAEDKKFPLPFPFPSKFYIMCIANAEEVRQIFYIGMFRVSDVEIKGNCYAKT